MNFLADAVRFDSREIREHNRITTKEVYPGHWQAWRGDLDLGVRIGNGRSVSQAVDDLNEQERK